jgi:hypothetical protein
MNSIINHEINEHTIIIDDLEFVNTSISIDYIKTLVLNKNPNYRFIEAKASDTTQLIITT